jgi:hypothetical protein
LDPSPQWAFIDFVLEMGEALGHCEGGVYLEEEKIEHPEQVPLLALRQVDDEGFVCGEVWFSPAQLPQLTAALIEQLRLNYTPGARRWRGMPDGPLINLAMPADDATPDEHHDT